MSTRADPPLPLSRLRARGELVEVRAADLRFTTEEAEVFLNELRRFWTGSRRWYARSCSTPPCSTR
jgi:hypothetical protein